jgi:hypothetical protein
MVGRQRNELDATVVDQRARADPKGGRLAVGNVDAVPAGKYGKASLEKLGPWDGVKDKIAQAESVRAALMRCSFSSFSASDPNARWRSLDTVPRARHCRHH